MSATQLLLTVCGLWVASEIGIMLWKRSDASKAERKDRLSIHVLWICLMIGPILASNLTRVRATEMPAAIRPYAYWGGLALIVIGVAIRWTAIATLKRYFTVDVAIAKDHKVIDHGLYSIVRHPSYAGSLLSFVGLGLAFLNWLSLAACMVFSILGLSYRIAVEERALTEALGDDYRSYAARTKRLIPGVF
ncbi:MAG: methyltransferase family protein [Thermoanaerobaculia bacterium]